MKRTKIICTIGPASEKNEILEKMIKAGMDVARLNFSHGNYKEHECIIKNIRRAAKKIGKPIAIMQDLQGPRIRVGIISKNGLEVTRQDKVALIYGEKTNSHLKDYKIIPQQFKELAECCKPKNHILINDGLIDIKIIRVQNDVVFGQVVKPGIIFSNKGINLPQAKIKKETLTLKDKRDLAFGLQQNVDYVALSFVNNPEDVKELKKIIPAKKEVEIIAKIETREGIKNFNEILNIADGIMVARGDLGIEMPPNQVPLLQKEIIAKCLIAAKPVIVATQMLDSMILNPRPTRAEVSDVANAVIDHTDAVMLSGESAYGRYPVEAVKMMSEIISGTEKSPYDDVRSHFIKKKKYLITDSISAEVFDLAKENKARVIIVDSISGLTARLISRYRPETYIAVVTDQYKTLNKMALTWGAHGYYLPLCKNLDELIKKSINLVKKEKIVKKGDKIIVVTGQPVGKKNGMNLIKVQEI